MRIASSERNPNLLTLGLVLLVLLVFPAVAGAQLSLPKFWTFVEDGAPRLGNAVAAGDFDGDGYDDMAMGSPSADVAGSSNSGRLHLRQTSGDGTASWQSVYYCLDDSDTGDGYRLGAALAFRQLAGRHQCRRSHGALRH